MVIATTCHMHQDSFSLHPLKSYIPTVDATLEQTRIISDFPIITKEGKAEADDDYDLPDLLHPDNVSRTSESELDDDNILYLETGVEPDPKEDSPQPITQPTILQ
jgi:hypothetical protein